jgi:hypothetical protein
MDATPHLSERLYRVTMTEDSGKKPLVGEVMGGKEKGGCTHA